MVEFLKVQLYTFRRNMDSIKKKDKGERGGGAWIWVLQGLVFYTFRINNDSLKHSYGRLTRRRKKRRKGVNGVLQGLVFLHLQD